MAICCTIKLIYSYIQTIHAVSLSMVVGHLLVQITPIANLTTFVNIIVQFNGLETTTRLFHFTTGWKTLIWTVTLQLL